jgi:hypothetical protein
MEIIQEMEENKGTDDMYTEFKKNLIIYLQKKSLLITQLISNKIKKDLNEKKITPDKMNKEETRIKKLKEIFNSNGFKNNIHKTIGKKLLFTDEATQGFFVKFIKEQNDESWKEIYQQIKKFYVFYFFLVTVYQNHILGLTWCIFSKQ